VFKSPLGHPGLPTELPVSDRQNCGGDLVRLCVELARISGGGTGPQDHSETSPQDRSGTAPEPPAALGREALEQAIIGKAVDLLSGPGGLASFLRRRKLGARLAGPSLPLDVGVSKDIPAAIRAAVILRDKHCRWAGGCDQPASACEVHHVRHKAHGRKTSVRDCVLFYCSTIRLLSTRWAGPSS